VAEASLAGCPRSRMETVRLYEYFRLNGWQVTRRLQKADLVLIATCGVDSIAETTCMREMHKIAALSKTGTQWVITGCLAGINEPLLTEKFPHARLIPPMRSSELNELIDASVKLTDIPYENYLKPKYLRSREGALKRATGGLRARWRFYLRHLLGWRLRTILINVFYKNRQFRFEPVDNVFSIKIADGCLGECSYCAIRFAEGPLRSRSLEAILSDLDAGLERGFREFQVIASDICCWGQDTGHDVVELLSELFQRQGDFKVTFIDFGMKWFIQYAEPITAILANQMDRVRLTMLPIQSGSDTVLARMNRGYTAQQAREAVHLLRQRCPGLPLGTHILTGFPGETQQEFEQTQQFLREVKFERVDIYSYTDRPNTSASAMADKVPQDIINHRTEDLRQEFERSKT
jgi:tRNA A37 methylthiotransferase MiaB